MGLYGAKFHIGYAKSFCVRSFVWANVCDVCVTAEHLFWIRDSL